ncbi:MAG: hypothetical protein NZ553_01230 [Caldilinea sp.]|nr:hypothetical protein [Caldilinea sp.]MDW8439071.1 hypothetical protein [Caldilineaceae bacterium]
MVRNGWLGFFILVAAALLLRLWRIDAIPPGFHFDESFEGLEAWRIANDPTYRPIFLTGNFGVAPANAYANAIMFSLWTWVGGEPGPTAMRVTAALFGALGVVGTWLAADELRRLHPDRLTAALPWLAAGLLATMRWHIHFSRMGIEPILVPPAAAAAVWLLLRARRTQSWSAYIGLSVVLAFSIYAYQGGWVLPPLMALAWGILWQWDRERRRPLALGGGLAAAVVLLLTLPLLLFAIGQPQLFLLRPEQVAVGAGAATRQGIAENAVAYLLMFVPLVEAGDLDPRRNLPGLAALNLWQAIPFWLGIALALWRIRQPGYRILLLLLAGLLLPGVVSEYAPHYHRVLGAAAPAALLGGVGLDWLWRWGARTNGRPVHRAPRRLLPWLSAALLALGAIVSVRDYFVRWAALPDLFYAFDVGLWTLAQQIAAQPADAVIYLTPRSADHPTLAFAWETQPGGHGPPVTFDGRHIFPLNADDLARPEQYIVIEEEDFRTRLLLPELFPEAVVTRTLLDWQGRVYANTYVRPTGSMPQRQPMVAATFEIGDGVALAGYDAQLAQLEAGQMLYVQLYWEVRAAPVQNWTVFVHLLDEDGGGPNLVAGVDSLPGAGSLPTTRWQAGWRILDEYQLLLPNDLPDGNYALSIGLYTADGARLPAEGIGLRIGEVHIE